MLELLQDNKKLEIKGFCISGSTVRLEDRKYSDLETLDLLDYIESITK